MTESPRCCPVCEGNEVTHVLSKEELVLVRCSKCAMVFASPAPREFAEGAYYEDAGRPFYLSPEKLAGDFAPVRFERELRLFRRFCASGSVLDVGCSTGAFLTQLGRRFPGAYDSWGTDISGPPLDYAERLGVKVVRGNFLTHDFGDRQFDAITFWAVLEHVVDPKAFLERAKTLLRTDGLCFVLAPNFDSLAVRLLRERYRYILGQHLNYFTPGTLAHLAERYFARVHRSTTHFNPVVIWQDWRSKAAVKDRDRAQLLVKTNALKQSGWLRPIRMGYSGVERMLAGAGLADNCVFVGRNQAD